MLPLSVILTEDKEHRAACVRTATGETLQLSPTDINSHSPLLLLLLLLTHKHTSKGNMQVTGFLLVHIGAMGNF